MPVQYDQSLESPRDKAHRHGNKDKHPRQVARAKRRKQIKEREGRISREPPCGFYIIPNGTSPADVTPPNPEYRTGLINLLHRVPRQRLTGTTVPFQHPWRTFFF